MAQPERREPLGAVDRFITVLAAVILAAAGIAFILATIRFAAVASRDDYSPWTRLGIPQEHGGRIGLLLVAVLVAILVLAAALRRRDPMLSFPTPAGGLRVRAGGLEDAIRDELALHPDVLRVSARVRLHNSKLAARVEVVARPMTDTAALRELAEQGTRSALCTSAGLPADEPDVEVAAVSVRALKRYL